MGGKKKLTLKQMERMQMRKGEEEKKAAGSREKKPTGIIPPDIKSGKMVDELKKMKVLTPYTVASRFNLRISVAKDLLEQLEDNGTIQLVSGNHNIKIYRTLD
jgi:small subunit ribosomal protein S25e